MLLLSKIWTHYCNKKKENESTNANFNYGKETKKGDTIFMTLEDLEALVDDAWHDDDDDDDHLVKRNTVMMNDDA